jgi:endonuclease-3
VLKKYFSKRIGSVHKYTPFEVLISCILSQRTREENTEIASDRLFRIVSTPEEILRLNIRKIESLIKPAGFYRQKAKRIKEVSRILLEKYNGKVPKDRKELMSLPGVGFKTSAIVLSYGYNIPIIAVDTHVNRISKRLGLVKKDADVEKVREALESVFPKDKWFLVNLGCVNFGREVCRPIRPRCEICELRSVCNFYNERSQI